MSHHIVSIDEPVCDIFCRDGRLFCASEDLERSLPLEDVAAVVVTSFAPRLHGHLLVQAAKLGVAFVLCENFRPAAVLLPANRATDTLLTKAHVSLPKRTRDRLWDRIIDAKVRNQASLAGAWGGMANSITSLERLASGRRPSRESLCARSFWAIFADAVLGDPRFRRDRDGGGANQLLNYGYAVLLSSVLQLCFALGLDPTIGLHHAVRERSTPLAYDLMEPFRPAVDREVASWIANGLGQPLEVTKEFRRAVTAFLARPTDYQGHEMDLRAALESSLRSFRNAVLNKDASLFLPWIQPSSRWVG